MVVSVSSSTCPICKSMKRPDATSRLHDETPLVLVPAVEWRAGKTCLRQPSVRSILTASIRLSTTTNTFVTLQCCCIVKVMFVASIDLPLSSLVLHILRTSQDHDKVNSYRASDRAHDCDSPSEYEAEVRETSTVDT